jgi:hypothetical protein
VNARKNMQLFAYLKKEGKNIRVSADAIAHYESEGWTEGSFADFDAELINAYKKEETVAETATETAETVAETATGTEEAATEAQA